VEDAVEKRDLLRRRLRAERSALAPAEVRAASEACCAHGQPLVHGTVALYSAVRGEIDPSLMKVEHAVWPRTGDDGSLAFHQGPLSPGRWDIPEPAADAPRHEPDVICVPGVAFDRAGHRLGYGRGYYDRALNACPGALRIGFSHSFQLVDGVDPRPHDEPVDWIVTPYGATATHTRAFKETS